MFFSLQLILLRLVEPIRRMGTFFFFYHGKVCARSGLKVDKETRCMTRHGPTAR